MRRLYDQLQDHGSPGKIVVKLRKDVTASAGSRHLRDEELWAHFHTLGVGSISGYKLWCHRHGFSMDLEKRPDQRLVEIELCRNLHPAVDPNAGKDHDPLRVKVLKRIFLGELANEPLTDIPSRVRKLYHGLAGDDESRRFSSWPATMATGAVPWRSGGRLVHINVNSFRRWPDTFWQGTKSPWSWIPPGFWDPRLKHERSRSGSGM